MGQFSYQLASSSRAISTAAAFGMPPAASSSRISRKWSDLNPDLLSSIFSRLSSPDLITGVSLVCSSWRAAARNKQFWRVLDFSDWTGIVRGYVHVNFSKIFISVMCFVPEYYECIEEVYFPLLANEDDIILVSNRLPNLSYIYFPSSLGPWMRHVFSNFRSLKSIALNYYLFLLSRPVLIPDLCELKLLVTRQYYIFVYADAKWICKSYPKLRKLEIPNFVISTNLIEMLLDSLEHLEYLDISGCEISRFHKRKRVIDKATSKLKVFIRHGINTRRLQS